MADIPTIFDAASNARIARGIRSLETQATNLTGKANLVIPRRNEFWAKIGASTVGDDGLRHYAWTLQYIKHSADATINGKFDDYTNIDSSTFSGSTTTDYALNVKEQGSIKVNEVVNGTFVWMWQGNDDKGYPVWRFDAIMPGIFRVALSSSQCFHFRRSVFRLNHYLYRQEPGWRGYLRNRDESLIR